MRMTIFPSDKGDCLLLSSGDGKNLLVDGGMRASYRAHVAQALSDLDQLDVVCVSHIDQDHISGILQMMDDILEWRVHDYQLSEGNDIHKEPTAPRPPDIGEIWHNAFEAQVPLDPGDVETALVLRAAILEVIDTKKSKSLAEEHRDLVASIPEAIGLNQRISPQQLDIPLNPPFDGNLMLVANDPPEISIGAMSVGIIGPFQEELDELREEWDEWVAENEEALRKLQERGLQDEKSIGNEIDRIVVPLLAQSEVLGDINKVTTPNLASLMLLVEEGATRLLLTGDGHHKHVLEGLKAVNKLDPSGGLHVDVLKVQHHGSEHNIDSDFTKAVTADHYVFCSNGAHENPDLRVVDLIVESRLGPAEARSTNQQVDDPFTLWFNFSSAIVENEGYKAHAKEVEERVRELAEEYPGKFEYTFLGADGSSDDLFIELSF